jgi:hypothetical protein
MGPPPSDDVKIGKLLYAEDELLALKLWRFRPWQFCDPSGEPHFLVLSLFP